VRIGVTLLCAVPVVLLAYLASGAVHPANSARPAYNAGLAQSTADYSASTSTPGRRMTALAARTRPTTYRIAFFGDSVSVGFGSSHRGDGYVGRVSSWLRTHGTRVITTNNARGGVPVGYWMYAPMPKQLDAAVIELGTNDVRLGTPPEQFALEYRTLTSRIRAANPHAQILCLSVWSHPAGASPDSVINKQIRAVCPGTYVDITRLRDRPHIRSSDGFHPNDLGYRLIAQAVRSKLKTS
jgi:lysophospholipase L1-like esterase